MQVYIMRRSPSRTSSDACSAPDEPAAVALVPSALRAGVPGSPPPVVLSHGLWIRRYGRDPAIVGRSLTIDGLRTTDLKGSQLALIVGT